MSESFKTTTGTMVAFGDVVVNHPDQIQDRESAGIERIVGLDDLISGDLRVRSWKDIDESPSFKTHFTPGQTLFGKRRAYLRKVAIAEFEGVCTQNILVLESKDPEVLLPELLPFLCSTDAFFDHAIDTSEGSLFPNANWKSMQQFEFALPPLEEQRRICVGLVSAAEVASTLTVLVNVVERNSRALSTQFFSELISRYDDAGVPLANVFDHIVDSGHEELPILSVTIGGTVVRRDSLDRHISDDTGDQKYLRVQPGDIAYNTMRLWQGSVGVVQEEGLVSPAYTVLRPRDADPSSTFFLEMLRSPALQQQYRRFVRGVASDRWRLYFKDLSQIRVTLPAASKCAEILDKLDQLRVAEQVANSRLRHVVRLLKTMRIGSLGS